MVEAAGKVAHRAARGEPRTGRGVPLRQRATQQRAGAEIEGAVEALQWEEGRVQAHGRRVGVMEEPAAAVTGVTAVKWVPCMQRAEQVGQQLH